MRWWWTAPAPPDKLTDAEIVKRVNSMIRTGAITPEMAPMFERSLRAVADGKAVDMNDMMRSVPKPRPPRRPRWSPD